MARPKPVPSRTPLVVALAWRKLSKISLLILLSDADSGIADQEAN